MFGIGMWELILIGLAWRSRGRDWRGGDRRPGGKQDQRVSDSPLRLSTNTLS
jgi:hypothetical protein